MALSNLQWIFQIVIGKPDTTSDVMYEKSFQKTSLATPDVRSIERSFSLERTKVIFKQNSFIPPIDLRELIIHLNNNLITKVNIPPRSNTKEHLTMN